ncbi:MAG: nucleotidyltransferase family protein [Clostridia bacterium]|nr:nucleotidyltransferase family protein [Clostridia bacterium]
MKVDGFIGTKQLNIVEAMQRIDKNTHGILFIVDESDRLCGCLTDGDLRRWIIKTGGIEGYVGEIMNNNPKYTTEVLSGEAYAIMKKCKIKSIPVVDSDMHIINVLSLDDAAPHNVLDQKLLEDIPVIVMAGGKGTRLYPYTKILPKPLIPIGDVPILERILNRFYEYGADKFYITVNYKKEMIKSYFKDLSPEYNIDFVEEDKPLGTAGSICLIEENFDSPVIVTNCDILIQADYNNVITYHKESGNAMTIVSSLKNSVIPYGVINLGENGVISSMEEKPTLSHFINTGMYVVEPECLKLIPKDTVFHMTNLAEKLMEAGKRVGMFPIGEDAFLDMGQIEEMKRMEEMLSKRAEK